ncbi:MAG: hypothetical protein VB934_17645, partial [Polyangiaceae bacterium]
GPGCEFGAFMFLHQERIAQEGRLGASVVKNMAYWLMRTPAERAAFLTAAELSRRPDARAFTALGQALSWVEELGHVDVHAVDGAAGESYGLVETAGLLVPDSRKADLGALLDVFREVEAEVGRAYFAAHVVGASEERSAELCAWLREAAPPLLLTSDDGQVLWDGTRPESIAALRSLLGKLTADSAASLREDWQVVAERTTQVYAAIREPERLADVFAVLDQEEGGTYIHRERKQMAYCLKQPGFEPCREPAPPYHRLLLAARTLHEWGHVLEEAGLVGIPESAREAFARGREQIVDCLGAILREAQSEVKQLAEHEARALGLLPYSERNFAEGLTERLLERMPDFLANLVVARFASQAEIEAYVRVNVRKLDRESEGPFSLLLGLVYSYQYLRFSCVADPRAYFEQLTGCEVEFVQSGFLSADRLEALLAAVAAVCDAYAMDEVAFFGAATST